jgi:hypothetical protein
MTYEFIVSARADFQPAAETICLDMDKITLPLWIRSRREGDRFEPVGMTGSKNHQKVSYRQKDSCPGAQSEWHADIGTADIRGTGPPHCQSEQPLTKTERILVIKGCLDAKTREADPSGDRNCPHCKG